METKTRKKLLSKRRVDNFFQYLKNNNLIHSYKIKNINKINRTATVNIHPIEPCDSIDVDYVVSLVDGEIQYFE